MANRSYTPNALAARLGISAPKLRATLRKLYPRPVRGRKKRWHISEDMAKKIEALLMPTERRGLAVRVVSQKGTCAAGHKVGDEFIIGDKTQAGMCSWAFYAVFPFATVLQYDGSFPWEKKPDKTTVACPDPENPVVFELRRLRE